MTLDETLADLESENPSEETKERAADALAFVESLQNMFVDSGMTDNVASIDELENLIDALHGELAAAVLFLCEPSFARVPDMLRVVTEKLEKMNDGSIPTVVVKGFARMATRIENTRKNQQQMALIKTT